MLRRSVLSDSHGRESVKSRINAKRDRAVKAADVRVHWDPERTTTLERLEYPGIQIGIRALLVDLFGHGNVKIEDVMDRARELKRIIDENAEISDIGSVGMALVPTERVFIVE